jgi:hypothetical protein
LAGGGDGSVYGRRRLVKIVFPSDMTADSVEELELFLNLSSKRRSAVPEPTKSQLEKFKEAARQLEADEDEARWDERLRKVAGQKLPTEKPE